MNILIDKAGFENKGAQLMLSAIKDKVADLYPHAKFVIRENIAGVSIKRIRQEGFYVLKDLNKGKYKFLPNRFTHNFGIIRPSDIDVLLDAGGFQFGDQWTDKNTDQYINHELKFYSFYKKHGTKIILMPQAFGPFTENLSKKRVKIAFENADLIYARDKTSLNYLEEVVGKSSKIKLSPDFTNLYKPEVPLTKLLPKHVFVGVIPNQKMITHTNDDVANNYYSFLLNLCENLIERGEKLVLLNHEGQGDYEIIKKLKSNLPDNIIVLSDLNSAETKAIIGRFKLLISSRFHGVVSGLSQGVVTFCTGWSHKYQELLTDYDVSENYLPINNFAESFNKISAALDNPSSSQHKQSSEKIENIKNSVNEMWKEISDNYLNK